MPTSQKPRKKFTPTVRPTKQFLPSGGPVLIYTPATKRTRPEPCGPEIKCKVGDSNKLLIKVGPGQEWYHVDTGDGGYVQILEEILVSLLLVDGVVFDYSPAAREEMPVTNGTVPGGTDIGTEH